MNPKITDLHIAEIVNIDRSLKTITVLGDNDESLVVIENANEENIINTFQSLRGSGIIPQKIYIPTWSKLSPILVKVWPDTQVLLEYKD